MDGLTGRKQEVEIDQSGLSFQDPVWLQQWGLGAVNALDYFALSPFYDKSCSNEICRMQGLDPTSALRAMTGTEYVLADLPPEDPPVPSPPLPEGHQVQPRLFVILKRYRRTSSEADVRSIYYIMDGTIYQAPTVLSLINSRLNKFAFHISTAFGQLLELPQVNANGGYDWAWNKVALEEMRRGKREEAGQEATLTTPKVAVDNILLNLVERHLTSSAKPLQEGAAVGGKGV